MSVATFRARYREPVAGTAVAPASIGLGAAAPLLQWAAEGIGGVYRHGLLSLCSVRENGGELGDWAAWLPQGVRLFASSAFGFLYCSGGADLWVVDPQYGQVVESDVPLVEVLDLLCEPGVRHDDLREPLLRRWRAVGGADPLHAWLCPTPALALGGSWQVSALKPAAPAVFLGFTAGLFDRAGPNAVQVRRLPGTDGEAP